MVRKKIDDRIRILIENGVVEKHRTMFVVIGEKAKDQVVLLHHILSKATANEIKKKPSTILWCSKKEIGFNNHHNRKRIKLIKNKIKAGKFDANNDDPFELFIVSNNIRYCYYNESHKVLGNTYGMCILEDFQALTPNLLARTIETVEGGGIIVILLQSVNSLKQLYKINMDVHQRFRTEGHQNVVCRFNERFFLSLASCKRCLVVNDNLKVLPITLQNLQVESVTINSLTDENTDLNIFKETCQDNKSISALINCCKTIDQAKALQKFIETISEKKFNSTVSLTAARGRGKSATLGLAIAGAVAYGYSNIYISSPSPENINTLFEFIFNGFDALDYKEHCDYNIVKTTDPLLNEAIVRVNIFRNHRQTIQYIDPSDNSKLSQAELLVIDEAAAIPFPYVKAMLGPYLIFLSSTINGYEGTGRSLSLKLLQQLRVQTKPMNKFNSNDNKNKSIEENHRQLYELNLTESIRYKPGDEVEEWLTNILCLDSTTHTSILSWCPPSNTCQLYYINRDTLFSYHKASELFLQRLVALYVASHYKNSPNDLQMMSDAPAHHLFCLLGPINPDGKSLPEILVVIQVCLEGELKEDTIANGLGRGQRAAGDLIPWTIAQQYQDNSFARLAGARIVRIATHPDYHSAGYGSRALQLLKEYYEMKIPIESNDGATKSIANKNNSCTDDNIDSLLDEMIEPRLSLPPLLSRLNERQPERLDYIGVSFGLTESLLKFWKRSNFVMVYLRQTTNEITGEHSCIMLSKIGIDKNVNWLETYWKDFRRRFVMLLSYSFTTYSPSLALSILTNNTFEISYSHVDKQIWDVYFTSCDLKRLEMYGNNVVDYHLIMDLLPSLAKLYFLNFMKNVHFSPVQESILLGLGFQHKTVDRIAEELSLSGSQLLGLFNRIVRKSVQYFNSITEEFNENTKSVINQTNVVDSKKKLVNNLKILAIEKLQGKQKSKLKQKSLTTIKNDKKRINSDVSIPQISCNKKKKIK
ncbi:hypothetical protein PV327_001510 [Microctonus hyperodae]|uniref:RNA cytidine acetyltransferase n=1 Tax=Microctonus hyperodae TaxID=165561 RepID=A0AA39G8G1_MICHY|nr:hypothetical protein PV327_001510 [Microctonus hyperodae]